MPTTKDITADQLKCNCHGRKHPVKQASQEELGYRPADREREKHGSHVNRPDEQRLDESWEANGNCQKPERPGQTRVMAKNALNAGQQAKPEQPQPRELPERSGRGREGDVGPLHGRILKNQSN
jgi:hypothetical protein